MTANRPCHFFIIGAAKCGTTTVHHWLDQHPDICMSRPKEPAFFERDFHRGLDYYRESCFAHYAGERFAGEARHRNLFLRYIPKRLAESYPDAVLIAVLRNPVTRAFSHYLHRKRHGQEDASFEAAIDLDLERIEREKSLTDQELERRHVEDLSGQGANRTHRTYVDTGHYAEQLQRYFELFAKEKIKVFLTEDLRDDPQWVYREMISALSPDLRCLPITLSRENANPGRLLRMQDRLLHKAPMLQSITRTLVPRPIRSAMKRLTKKAERSMPISIEESMRPDTRDRLIAHYREHNQRLARLINRDLSFWDK